MLRVFVVLAILASSLARPQHFHIPLNFALPQQQQPIQQIQQQAVAPAPAPLAPPVPLTNPTQVISGSAPDGSSVFGYQTLDGQSRSESVGLDGSVRGSYSYVDANGKPVTVNYIADNQGFRTSADPVPVGTPGRQVAAAPAPAPAPAPQQQLFSFQIPQQQQQFQQLQQAPAPAPAAPAQSFTPFFSPLPATNLPLSHFGFQPLQAAAPQAPAPAPAPQPAPVAPVRQHTPIIYSFTTQG